jgi:hypothetical protein
MNFEHHYGSIDYEKKEKNVSERICDEKEAVVISLRKVVPPARFQRATFRLGGGRSMQLSYGSTSEVNRKT